MLSKASEIEILRLYHVEKWKIHAISRHFNIHRSVVRRILSESGQEIVRSNRVRLVDPYIPFIKEQLEKYPTISATRLCEMAKQRGYQGKITEFRARVSELKPKRAKQEAFLRLRTLPGEEAQVDWGHFGNISIDGNTRQLMAFVITLSYSRATYLAFFPSASMGHFLAGHAQAFKWFGGIPKVCKYDNLKSVVIERVGKAIKFNKRFLEFAGGYRFEPRPVGVRRGNEKGRVERFIRYIRSDFFTGRSYRDLEDLNYQALKWCESASLARRWMDDQSKTVKEQFEQERKYLTALPDISVSCEERIEVAVGKTPYIRFDLNDYSVPHHLVGRTLVVQATTDSVAVYYKLKRVALHSRSYGRGITIQDSKHLSELKQYKKEARAESNTHFLIKAIPIAEELLKQLSKNGESGISLRTSINSFTELVELYGTPVVESAMKRALADNSVHPATVRNIIEAERGKHNKEALKPLPIDDPRLKSSIGNPHSLETYQTLIQEENHNEND